MNAGDLFLATAAVTTGGALGVFVVFVLFGLAMRILTKADMLIEAAWFYVQRRKPRERK